MRNLLLLLLTTACCLKMEAQDSQTAYNFMRLPDSAHAAALGGDNISIIEDDASLIFNNPALLSSVTDKTIGLGYMNYMSGANTASATFNRVIQEKSTVAVSAQFIDYGKIKETDENNIETGSFNARDISVGAYFSYLLSNRLSGGICAKFITSYIGDYNSLAMGVDLGLNYYDPETEWSLSLVGKNLGGQLKAYDDNFEKMPIDVQAGISKHFVHTPLRLSATMTGINNMGDYKFINHLVMGAELILSPSIWVGGGYNFRRANDMRITATENEFGDDGKSNHGAGLSLGAGVNLENFKLNIAYGKYHVSSSSLVLNVAYSL